MGSLFKEIRAEYTTAKRGIECGWFDIRNNFPHLLQHPGCLCGGWLVCVAAVEDREIPDSADATIAKVELATNATLQSRFRRADIFRSGQRSGQLRVIFQFVAKG